MGGGVATAVGRRGPIQAAGLIMDSPKHYSTPKYPKMIKKYENQKGSFMCDLLLYSQVKSVIFRVDRHCFPIESEHFRRGRRFIDYKEAR